MRKIFAFGLIALLLGSCVSKKQYSEALGSEQRYYDEAQQAKKDLIAERANVADLQTDKENLLRQIELLKADTARQGNRIAALGSDIDNLNKLNQDLTEKLGKSKSEEEVKALLGDLKSLQEKLKDKEVELNNVSRSLDESRAALDAKESALQKEQATINAQQAKLETQQAKLKELTDVLAQKDSLMRTLKDRVSSALTGYEGNGLTVTNKNGKVYVSLEEQLLFKSGKWDVDTKGEQALEKLSAVLGENPDIRVEIEGHTDDVPYNGSGAIADNWDLSTKRATSIVRILLRNPKIDPVRITASGRGEYLPIDTAKTTEARQKNRRTEIILSPDIDTVLDLLSK